MILIIAKLVAKLFKIDDLAKVQRYVIVALFLLGGLIAIYSVYKVVDWLTPDADVDLETVEKINRGNEKQRKEELTKKVDEYADVVKTVDGRNTIANTSINERNERTEEVVEQLDKKIMEVKTQEGRDVTEEELECLLVGTCK